MRVTRPTSSTMPVNMRALQKKDHKPTTETGSHGADHFLICFSL
jgi:hypothetical protein